MIIDGHIHAGYWSPEMFLGRGVPYQEIDACLQACGIGGAVLTSTDLRRNREVLDFIGRSRQLRYWFFPWVKPGAEADLAFLKKHADRIDGIKLHPSCDRIKVTDPRVEPLLVFARDTGIPVMVHCGRWQEMSSYRLALEVACWYPETSFVLSHMGGAIPELETATVDMIEDRKIANAYLGIEGVREYWAVQMAVDRLGADRVIFGSDFPLGHPKLYMGLVNALTIDDAQRNLIMGGNILRLVGGGPGA